MKRPRSSEFQGVGGLPCLCFRGTVITNDGQKGCVRMKVSASGRECLLISD